QFDKEDLHQLWTLVKETFSIKQATRDKEKELWVELKRLFEPNFEDHLWTHHQAFMHDTLDWKLYHTCGVHHVSTKDQEIFMLVEKDYPLRKGLATVMIIPDEELLEASSLGDYVDKKRTSGICTFVGYCLTSWFSKKQTALAISTTEAEYVITKKACQQALWMKQALLDYDIRLDDVPIMRSVAICLDLLRYSIYVILLYQTRMPNNVKTYDGTGDPEDHVKIFQATEQVKWWAMPTWCHMFNSILIWAAIVWFDELPPESVDSYKDLKAALLAYFMQQKKYVKDPVEIHNIKQRDGETIEDFIERSEHYNLVYFVAKQMEFVIKQPGLILPNSMLLTRLFKYVISMNPELSNDRYVLYDHVMYSLTAQQERKTRNDYGMRRGVSSTSSSSTFGQPSSSHLNNDDNDGNDEGTSHASTHSPTCFVNSLKN
nr:reverse transcriptase domain-containing protein [Tanacetum cinerariifolium]